LSRSQSGLYRRLLAGRAVSVGQACRYTMNALAQLNALQVGNLRYSRLGSLRYRSGCRSPCRAGGHQPVDGEPIVDERNGNGCKNVQTPVADNLVCVPSAYLARPSLSNTFKLYGASRSIRRKRPTVAHADRNGCETAGSKACATAGRCLLGVLTGRVLFLII
jgi:hypothetical protein